MMQVQASLGCGTTQSRYVVIFEAQQALRQLVDHGREVGGGANVAAMVAGQGGVFTGAVAVSPGVYRYYRFEPGRAAQPAVSGTKFFRVRDLK